MKTVLMWLIPGLIMIGSLASAQRLLLKDGTVIEGQIRRTDGRRITIMSSRGIATYDVMDFDEDTRQEHFSGWQPQSEPANRSEIEADVVHFPDQGIQAVDSSAPPDTSAISERISLNQALEKIAERIIADMAKAEVRQLSVSKIYFNGSGLHPLAKFAQRVLLGKILQIAPETLTIMEREDIRLLLQENQLHMVTGTDQINVADESDALLMGELLFDPNFSQILVSIRIFNTLTTEILSANLEIVDVDSDLGRRLGIAEPALSKKPLYAPSPEIKNDVNFLRRISDIGHFAVAPAINLPEKYRFPVRVFYAYALTEFVNFGIPMLERELLFQIADEQMLQDQTIDSIFTGDGIIQAFFDESSSESSPIFFIRALVRDGGRLLAQSKVTLISPSKKIEETFHSVRHQPSRVTSLGADDSIAAAIRDYHDSARPQSTEDFRFREVFSISGNQNIEGMINSILRTSYLYWSFRGYDILNLYRGNVSAFPQDVIRQFPSDINIQEHLNNALRLLIAKEEGNVEAIRAGIVAYHLLVSENANQNQLFLIGPLSRIYFQVIASLTINRDRTLSISDWHDAFNSFARIHYLSMHPQHRIGLSNPIDPYRGTFSVTTRRGGDTEFVFHYSINTDWQGALPGTTTVSIDFSPMRDRLFRVAP